MTRIDFYVLSSSEEVGRLRLACRLADKIFRLGKKLYIHTENAKQNQELDNLLWTFQDISFLPHDIASEELTHNTKMHEGRVNQETTTRLDSNGSADPELSKPQPSPILIGHSHTPPAYFDVLINLARETPLFFSRFERLAEIVDEQANNRAAARARYRFYRDRGYPLQHHHITV